MNNQTQNIQRAETKNTPERKFSAGALQVTIWRNTKSAADGKTQEYKTFSFTRRYQDTTGQWKSTNSLRINDLPKAVTLLSKAYEYAVLRQNDEEIAI